MSDKKANPAVEYVQESVMELKRITWPTGKQAFKLTLIVIGFCLVFAAIIGLVDWLFNFGYTQLLDLAQNNKL
ncbi:preprotein translocase subunit SecE [Candidatus Peregrinibacteria bacterium]|nr:preprotein translocase subunit SecE [Candidatus Peregrinibacteria bacterium]